MGSKKVSILGIPSCLGQTYRGTDMGPSAIRAAGLQEALVALDVETEDLGDIVVPGPEIRPVHNPHARYLPEIAAQSREAADKVHGILAGGATPINLGGDHSVSVGTVAGAARFCRESDQRLGVLWLDAHGDLNTPETTPSGNIHGMALAASIGLGPDELTAVSGVSAAADARHVALLGVRALDELEKATMRASGVHVYTMRDVDERGIASVVRDAIDKICDGTAGFHCSLDLDVVDPSCAPGVGTPVKGGISYREAHIVMEMIHDSGSMLSLDAVEVNPILDQGNQTGELAVELVSSAFGKRIY